MNATRANMDPPPRVRRIGSKIRVVLANPDHIDRLGVVAYSIAVRALVHGANRLIFRLVSEPCTVHPTAEWTAQQLREAFPWDTAPRYLLRDRDRIFGNDFVDQVKDHGHPTSAFCAAVALAACLCRTGDRHHSPGNAWIP
jgi:hypothetical protein